jgi:hypothetical protein
LPAAANSTTHASRQRLQNAGFSRDGRSQSEKSRSNWQDDKRKHRKIPELGKVDFAARRAQIQTAFTKSLQETGDQISNTVSEAPTHNTLIKPESADGGLNNAGTDMSRAPIDEEEEGEDDGEGKGKREEEREEEEEEEEEEEGHVNGCEGPKETMLSVNLRMGSFKSYLQ